jgi:8-oxo-dGTP diphosphatase
MIRSNHSRREEQDWLAAYRPGDFPPFAVTVDIALFTIRKETLCALLIQRAEPPYRGQWALPGGHIRHGTESAEQAAVRELHEETGVAWSSDNQLEQLATYTTPRRDPRIQAGLHVATVGFVALAVDLPEPTAATDATNAHWRPVESLDLAGQRRAWEKDRPYRGASPGIAFDHAVILDDALERVRAKLEYTTLATRFVTEPFSITDLRHVYRSVWGHEPDPANFRRKILATPGFLIPAPQPPRSPGGAGGRPPTLYLRGTAASVYPPLLRK